MRFQWPTLMAVGSSNATATVCTAGGADMAAITATGSAVTADVEGGAFGAFVKAFAAPFAFAGGGVCAGTAVSAGQGRAAGRRRHAAR